MPRIASALLPLAATLAFAAPANAATGLPVAPTTTTTTTTPTPKPAKASVKLDFRYAYSVDRGVVTIPGRTLDLVGVVRPYLPDQWVTVKAYLRGRLFKTSILRLTRSPGGTYGHFTDTLSSPRAGEVTLEVEHASTTTLAGFSARRRFAALDDRVTFGSTGRFVQLLQQRLAALHFYIPQTGVYDEGTGLAIDAYHRLLRRGTSQTLDHATITWLLNGWGAFPLRYSGHGNHAEGNLSLQLLALATGSRVYRIYPISSGKPSTPTILGDFRVYMKDPGYLPDGMYYSSFFYSGYAIHGYDPAPDYPASHGCMRVPIPDAISIYDWLGYGDWVDVYY